MLQIATFWDLYSFSPPIYIYNTIDIYTYIFTNIYINVLLLNFFDNIFIEDAMPEKALKDAHFHKI